MLPGNTQHYDKYTEHIREAVRKFNVGTGKLHMEWPTNFKQASTDFERIICLVKVLQNSAMGIFYDFLITISCHPLKNSCKK